MERRASKSWILESHTDIWALGAPLFQLLTGKTPFQHEGVTTAHAMIHAVLYEPPLRPRSLNQRA